ncbi:hypothetical protein ACMZOO_12225 [Catenovulum sp. SX2]|uniref:hypothetical protein n=1 Tax=Catenovulum sp. SX2 TaxID=3398614 RepID=UPI003F87A431
MTNPFINPPEVALYEYYKGVGVKGFLFQLSISLLAAGDYSFLWFTIPFVILLLLYSPEYKLIMFDANFRKKALIFYSITGLLSFMFGAFELFGMLMLLILVNLQWLSFGYKEYKKQYDIANDINHKEISKYE